MNQALLAVPLVLLAAVGVVRSIQGPGHGLAPLLAVGPAAAAGLGGPVYTAVIGIVALGEAMLLNLALEPATAQGTRVTALVIAGITAAGALASYARVRRERELTEIRTVADVAQQVVLRPIPDRVGPVRLAAHYMSASSGAWVGGDLYAVIRTKNGLRMIVGDAEGKGLPAVKQAATAMAAFRMAAREEGTLDAVAQRIEAELETEFDDEQFITAVLAEVSQDGREMVMLNCGHPQPLRLGRDGPELLGPAHGGLPLGLGPLAAGPRVQFTVPLRADEPVLLYTDGLSEARDKTGEFFPLTRCSSVQADASADTLVDRLAAEVRQYTGNQAHDDIALLLLWRPGSYWPPSAELAGDTPEAATPVQAAWHVIPHRQSTFPGEPAGPGIMRKLLRNARDLSNR